MKLPPFPGTLTQQWVERRRVTKTGSIGVYRAVAIVLTDEQREWFIRWFPEEENAVIMKATGMTCSTMHRLARQYGLVKSEKGLRRIRKRQAAHIKRVCERNGYYDSLRQRGIPEACREGARRMHREIREGLRPHPMTVIKQRSPRKYKATMKRRSEARLELIRREKWRMRMGLSRQTRLTIICLQPFTRRQVNHRYSALKRGYYVMADCSEGSGERWNIYYDQDTQRSELFERNLIADGFNLVEGTMNN